MKYIIIFAMFYCIITVLVSLQTVSTYETVVTGTHDAIPCSFETWETVTSANGTVISTVIVSKDNFCPCSAAD